MHPRRDQDNLGSIVAWHRRYSFTDPDVNVSVSGGDLIVTKLAEDIAVGGSSWFVVSIYLRKAGAAVVLPVYLYDHGMQALSTESWIGRAHQAEWDSAQVGLIFVTKAKLRQEYGVERITKKVIETATCVLRAEVEEYSDYLNGVTDEDD